MAKKNLLGDFEFKKLDGLNNGIDIPTTNSLKNANARHELSADIPEKKTADKKKNLKVKKSQKIELPDFDYKDKKISAMINVVPTSFPKKDVVPTSLPKKQKITDFEIDSSEYAALKNKEDKVLYLAMRGWSLKVEMRRNTLFHYATKYIKRKKQRIYLGSINADLEAT